MATSVRRFGAVRPRAGDERPPFRRRPSARRRRASAASLTCAAALAYGGRVAPPSLARLALTLLLVAGLAHGQAPPPTRAQRAQRHARKAAAHFEAGRYPEAIQEYQAAYKIQPDPQLQYSLAEANRLAGNKDEAVASYQRYLEAQPDGPDAPNAHRHLRELGAEPEPAAAATATPAPQPEPSAVAPAPRPELTAPAPAPARRERLSKRNLWIIVGASAGAAVVIALGVGLGVGLKPGETVFPVVRP
jgi:tetratricopeptide (TPR) repeat protein